MMATAGVAYFAYSVYSALVTKTTVPGWTSLVCLQVVFSGATLMAVGLLGDYVARIYEEAKGRPLYVIADTINLARNPQDVVRAIVLPPRDGEARQQAESDRRQVPSYRR
jgi:dolichol-phosphate mannosyltransferase